MTCCECDGYVSPSTQRQAHCHDVCSQRGAIKRAIESLQKADGILANAIDQSQAAAASVEDALAEICNDFGWKMPVAKTTGNGTWNTGFASGDAA